MPGVTVNSFLQYVLYNGRLQIGIRPIAVLHTHSAGKSIFSRGKPNEDRCIFTNAIPTLCVQHSPLLRRLSIIQQSQIIWDSFAYFTQLDQPIFQVAKTVSMLSLMRQPWKLHLLGEDRKIHSRLIMVGKHHLPRCFYPIKNQHGTSVEMIPVLDIVEYTTAHH